MKTIMTLSIALFVTVSALAQVKARGPLIGVSLGRPYLSGYKNEAPSNFSQVFAGYRFDYIGSIFTFTPRLSVQRNLITTSRYFEASGSEFQFTEAPNTYQNNRLMTLVATFGLGLSVHRALSDKLELEMLLEPQIGKNIANTQLFTSVGESQKRSVSNNPMVFGGEVSLLIRKKCSCGGTLMFGPGVLIQNGAYLKGGDFRSITPLISLAMVL